MGIVIIEVHTVYLERTTFQVNNSKSMCCKDMLGIDDDDK